ncbi:MAG: hypothetical protein K0S74_1045 [Chlamydiales bacterium]|jgi:hypothetical protein|nr:hypothetical protein [Chlamydiales bacterium]
MVSTINMTVGQRTPPSGLDMALPAVIEDGDKIFKKLLVLRNATTDTKVQETLDIMSHVAKQIKKTGVTEISDFWDKIESSINHRKPLKVAATTDIGKLNTAFSFFYSAINQIDTSDNMAAVNEIYSLYYETRKVIKSRFLAVDASKSSIKSSNSDLPSGLLPLKDQTKIKRVLDVIDGRFKNVVNRYNKRLEKEEIQGRKIQLALF